MKLKKLSGFRIFLLRGPVILARSGREFPFQGFEEIDLMNVF